MADHLSPRTIELLTGRRLAPEDLLAATRHLAACVECREKASEAAGTVSRGQQLYAELQSAVAEDSHPAYEQLEGYVDDSLTVKDREAIKRHFATCVDCFQEARSLESLRDNLKTYPALAGERLAAEKRREWSWERLAAFLRMRPGQLALLAVSLLLVAVVTVLLVRRPSPLQIANKNAVQRNSNVVNENSHVVDANVNPLNGNQGNKNGGAEDVAVSPYESIVKQTIEAQRITTPPAIRELAGKESQLLGPSEKQDHFTLISPVATLIRSTRPTFRWQSLPGASSYSVAILDLNLNLIEKGNAAEKLSWAPAHALKRNVVYTWQVTAVKDGREITAPAAPAREARFKIVAAEKSAAMARVETETAGSHLKLGIVYAHEGLLDDAEREFRAAIAADQEASLARKLLQNVRQIRR